MPDKYLTVSEGSELLQLSKGHVFAQVRQGRLPAIRLGRAIRFDPEVLRDWLGDHSTRAHDFGN